MSDYHPKVSESLREMFHYPLTWVDCAGIIFITVFSIFVSHSFVGQLIGITAVFFFLISLVAQYQVAQSALRIKQTDKDIVRLSNEIVNMVK
jgi:hypothetical protein